MTWRALSISPDVAAEVAAAKALLAGKGGGAKVGTGEGGHAKGGKGTEGGARGGKKKAGKKKEEAAKANGGSSFHAGGEL